VNGRKTARIIIGTIIIGTAMTYLLYEWARSSLAYYYSVDEFAERRAIGQRGDYAIRLAGSVKAGSIKYDIDRMQLEFELAGQRNLAPVRYCGTVPENFTDSKEVLVEGKPDANGVFIANQVLTRCESKYKAKLKPKE